MEPVVIAFIGGLAGALVSSVIGPFATHRAARLETFRGWQAELAEEFLEQLALVRGALEELRLKPDDDATKTKTSGLIEELNVLALRVELVFRQTMFRQKSGPPDAAREVIKQAKDALVDPLADPRHDRLDGARAVFVTRASNEIRGRWYRRERLRERS